MTFSSHRKIEIHARLLEDNPDVDVAYGSVRYFRDFRKDERLLSAGGRRSHSWVPELNGSGPEILDRLLQRNILPVHSALVRRTVYGDTPPFDERVRSGEDYLSWILLAAAGARFSYFDEEGARALIRVHGHNMSRDRLLRIRAMACAARLYEGKIRGETPPLFTAALAAEGAIDGSRLSAGRRFFGAAREADTAFVKFKYCLFAVSALVMPRKLLPWLLTSPVPEWIYAVMRK